MSALPPSGLATDGAERGGHSEGLPKSIFPPLKLDIRSFFVFFFQLASILSMIYSSRHMGSHINSHLVVNRTEN